MKAIIQNRKNNTVHNCYPEIHVFGYGSVKIGNTWVNISVEKEKK
jgi:hypothetical protein